MASNLVSRILVAVIAVPLLLLALYQPHAWIVWVVVFAASLIAMYELFAMTMADETDRRVATALGAAACALFYWLPHGAGQVPAFVFAALGPALYFLFRFGDQSTVAGRMAYATFGIVYAGLGFGFLSLIKRDFGAESGDLLVLILCTAWLSDTGGYFAGKSIGGKKLYPAVSPNKTWSGSIGGVVAAVGGAIGFKLWRMPELPWLDLVLLVGVGSVLGQLGDLAESLIKRSRGVKDSGAILPGHGGLLDRVDAVLFIAPYFYAYTMIRAALA